MQYPTRERLRTNLGQPQSALARRAMGAALVLALASCDGDLGSGDGGSDVEDAGGDVEDAGGAPDAAAEDGGPAPMDGGSTDAGADAGSDAGRIIMPGPETSLGVVGEKLDVAREPDGDMHLVYVRGAAVYHRRQVGGSWEAGERMVPAASYEPRWYPRVAATSEGDAHVAWAQPGYTTVRYVRYDAASDDFETPQSVITDGYGGGDTNRYDVAAASDGRVIVAAQSDFAIEYRLRPAGGSFGDELVVFEDMPTEPQFPALAVSGDGTFHCVYAENTPTEGLRHSWFDGSAWHGATRPAGDGGGCCANWSTATVGPDGRVHVAWIVWTDARGYGDLKYVSQDGSGGWDEIETLASGPDRFDCPFDECPLPAVAVSSSGAVLVVWAEASAGSSAVRYRLRRPGGAWPRRAAPITGGSSYQNHPAVVADGDTFHVFWTDERDGGAIRHRSITP